MFLDAPFRPTRESLHLSQQESNKAYSACLFQLSSEKHTFAISAQLFPVSRICLSRCSSAAVHGVFVRLFLATGGCIDASSSFGAGAAIVGLDVGRRLRALPANAASILEELGVDALASPLDVVDGSSSTRLDIV
jgi:hypothetical protein